MEQNERTPLPVTTTIDVVIAKRGRFRIAVPVTPVPELTAAIVEQVRDSMLIERGA